MKKTILLSALLLVSHASFAKDNTAQFQRFIPKGFHLTEHDCKGDFNKDGQTDCVLIIKDTQKAGWVNDETTENKPIDRNRRGIIVLFKTPNGYEKILENKAIFASENEWGGVYFPPDLTVESKANKLVIDYTHGRYGSWSYTFDYRQLNDKKDFYLIGYDSSDNAGPLVQSTHSVNFLNQRYRYQKNLNTNPDDDTQKFKTTWYNLPKKTLLKLVDIKDIDDVGKQLDEQLYYIVNPHDQP
ncbi:MULTISPECIES: hypothetical protein [unclassified Moraxella]|uniref:hypothetical protein n=1 Tax=unclassified Moraxella TaxID=2685852 RepID=UPI003AF88479